MVHMPGEHHDYLQREFALLSALYDWEPSTANLFVTRGLDVPFGAEPLPAVEIDAPEGHILRLSDIRRPGRARVAGVDKGRVYLAVPDESAWHPYIVHFRPAPGVVQSLEVLSDQRLGGPEFPRRWLDFNLLEASAEHVRLETLSGSALTVRQR